MPKTQRPRRGRRAPPKLAGWRNVAQIQAALEGSYTRQTVQVWIAAGKFDDEKQMPKKVGGAWYVSARSVATRKRSVTL